LKYIKFFAEKHTYIIPFRRRRNRNRNWRRGRRQIESWSWGR